ncbi:MAG: UDP-N-acetylmuramate--L-alanine ligase [Solirubrobacterales bacterium]
MSPPGWSSRELHFIAIGGAGMSGLALVCRELGAEVSGSDRAESSYVERLRAAGIEPRIGHDAKAVPPEAEVVVSTAIPDQNPELAIAKQRGQRVIHRGELLAELCEEKRLIAVAGTHGKTTTTAMIVWALRAIGADPAFFIGGELPGAGPGGEPTNAGWGEGEWVVAEADESDASFLRLKPEVAVVTNVELDHHSRWSSRAELAEAFDRFTEPARAVVREPEGAIDFELGVPGRHNELNALAALAAIEAAGFDRAAAAKALAGFPGVARRFEPKGSRNGALIYDDYAHHPTEVAAALEAARALTGGRLLAAFQPHLYSRTKAMAAEFGAALAAADEVAVLDVYAAREQPVGELEGVSGLMVAKATAERSGGRPVWWLPNAELAASALAPRLGEGDLLITLGAGDIFRLAEMLVEEEA